MLDAHNAMVEIGEHSKHRRFAERLRPYLKQRSSSAMLAYLCESEMLDQLAVSKVAFVRGNRPSKLISLVTV